MNLHEFKELATFVVKNEVFRPICAVGPMGIGKSQVLQQVARELKINYVDLRLGQMEVGDLIGLPFLKNEKTFWAKPIWWPEENSRGIIVLEEINRAPQDVRQAVFQLLTERKLHTHTLPLNWHIFSAINPNNGNYQVEDLDRAMIRRFVMIQIEPNVSIWKKWAEENNISADLINFISVHPDMFTSPDKLETVVFYNPDGMSYLNDFLTAGMDMRSNIGYEVACGIQGKTWTQAFLKYIKDASVAVTCKQIFCDWERIKPVFLLQKPEKMFNTLRDIENVVEDEKYAWNKKDSEILVDILASLSIEFKVVLFRILQTNFKEKILKMLSPESRAILGKQAEILIPFVDGEETKQTDRSSDKK